MIKFAIEVSRARTKLRTFAELAKKSIKEVIWDEARLTAKRLMDLTPPKKAAEGKKRIALDISRVYLRSEFFTELFNFKNESFGERIKSAIRRKDTGYLQDTFDNSQRLSQLHIESFKESIVKNLRKRGRIAKTITPHSFPVNEQGKIKSFTKTKEKLAGLLKSGWAACFAALGGKASAWLNKGNTGHIRESGGTGDDYSVTLVNTVDYAADYDEQRGTSRYALAGRKKDIQRKIDQLLKYQARKVDKR